MEKQQLLETLLKYGVNDMEKISNALPSKSVCDIRTIISKYRSMAARSLTEKSSPPSSTSTTSEAPVDMWIDLMKQILTKDNHNIMSRVLKYIALFENRTTDRIDLQDCYMVLADLTNGQPSKQLDPKTTVFFHDCLTKLAKSVKDNNNQKVESFLEELEIYKLTATKTYRSKNDKNPLISDVNLNPCKVPVNLLMDNNKT